MHFRGVQNLESRCRPDPREKGIVSRWLTQRPLYSYFIDASSTQGSIIGERPLCIIHRPGDTDLCTPYTRVETRDATRKLACCGISAYAFALPELVIQRVLNAHDEAASIWRGYDDL